MTTQELIELASKYRGLACLPEPESKFPEVASCLYCGKSTTKGRFCCTAHRIFFYHRIEERKEDRDHAEDDVD